MKVGGHVTGEKPLQVHLLSIQSPFVWLRSKYQEISAMIELLSTNLKFDREDSLIRSSTPFLSETRGEDKCAHLINAASSADLDGLWLEFGVSTGGSLATIAGCTAETIFGFDTFEGLPEDWDAGGAAGFFPAGSFKGSPKFLPTNVRLITGLFTDTLPSFLSHEPKRVAFMHIDCDLYQSTVDILDQIGDRIVPGTVIVFDEMFNYENYKDHEMRAWLEFCERRGVNYKYLGHVPDRSAASLIVEMVDEH
jgi:hypothetical protein